jgi:uncharacterized phage protein gp47/JayE
MPWIKHTLTELTVQAEEDLSVRLLDGAPLERRGPLSVIARMFSGGEYELYAFQYWMFLQAFLTTAEKEYLEEWGRIWSVTRKPAVSSQGKVTVKGTAGASLMDNSLAFSGNRQYRLTGVILTGTSGECEAAAVEPGLAGNLPAGAKISLVSPQAGISSELTVGPGALEGGVDEEDDEACRGRILKVIQSPPHGGNKADYEVWALQVPGVENALCIPTYSGLGSVAVAVWGDSSGPVLPEVTVLKAYEHIKALCPVTAGPGLFVFTPETLPVSFVIKVYEPDTPQVRENIILELGDVFAREARPGGKIPLTHLAEAISQAAGEYDHKLFSPNADITPAAGMLPVMGTVTFQDQP